MTISGRMLRLPLLAMAVTCLGASANPSGAQSESLFHTDGNASRVSVWGPGDEATAEPFAKRHCQSYGKAARYLRIKANHVSRFTNINSFVFDCTAQDEKVSQ